MKVVRFNGDLLVYISKGVIDIVTDNNYHHFDASIGASFGIFKI